MMSSSSNLRTICRPHCFFFSVSTFIGCRHQFRSRVSFRNPNNNPPYSLLPPSSASSIASKPWFRPNQRRTLVKGCQLERPQSPYETLELERDADEEQIRLLIDAWPIFTILMHSGASEFVESFLPLVYNGRGTLEEGETAESRFIKIQAAYELLVDEEKRMQYDKITELTQ
ncbi:hypothetical protein F8388_025894 [Cannabis sativa]|uniref:J domain-containing protein n=1 Tax=Cannabis sativa TaxID=3483 RepID=A0A7J6DQ79_CANSA|nr:hypothetical protein F8388_025894 [Cannabis sativa]